MGSSAREPGRAMPSRTIAFCFTAFFLLLALDAGFAATQSAISPSLTLQAAEARDQDDLTFWLHPSDLSQSTIITSDKKANTIFVYDLAGRTLQVVSAQKPGNIDTRYVVARASSRPPISSVCCAETASTAMIGSCSYFQWRPHGDSNPGYRRERAMS